MFFTTHQITDDRRSLRDEQTAIDVAAALSGYMEPVSNVLRAGKSRSGDPWYVQHVAKDAKTQDQEGDADHLGGALSPGQDLLGKDD